MNAGFGLSFVLMMLLGQGPNELLDLLPSKDYWQHQGVEMTAENVLADLTAADANTPAQGGQADVRRLMAIRTLGELRCKEALPALRKLADSKELFVADYAGRAIAAIEGRDAPRPGVSAAERLQDVELLPAGCGLVAQYALAPGAGPIDLAKVLAAMGPMAGPAPQEGGLDQLVKPLTEFAGMVGNLRVDAVTIGVAGEIDSDKGFVVVVARGLYDAKRAAAALKETLDGRDAERTQTIGGLEVFYPDREFGLIFASNQRLVLVSGPKRELMPVEQVVAAVKAGKGTLREDKELAKLIDAADKTGRLWMAVRMGETYRKAHPMLEPFVSAALVTKETKDAVEFSLLAQGDDADKVAAAVAQFNGELAKSVKGIKQAADKMPPLQPMAEFIESIQASQSGKAVTITAKFAGKGSAVAMLMPLMFFCERAAPATDTVRAEAVEQDAPPPPKAAPERR